MALAQITAAASQEPAQAAYRAATRLAARTFKVPLRHIEARTGVHFNRRAPKQTVLARRSALYLSVVAFDRSLGSIARAARMSKEGVRRALNAIEDARDDPAFDLTLTQLEQELAQ